MVERILELIKERGITALKMTADLGLSNSAVTDWKKGKAKPSVDAVVKIADYFGVTVDYLLGRVGDPNVELIPADPEKVKAHEQWLEQQREENRKAIEGLLKTATPDKEQPMPKPYGRSQ